MLKVYVIILQHQKVYGNQIIIVQVGHHYIEYHHNITPLFNSLDATNKSGFENFKIFLGMDGHLHLTGHNRGSTDVNGAKIQECHHYVSINSGDDDNEYGIKWKLVNMMKSFGQRPDEPGDEG